MIQNKTINSGLWFTVSNFLIKSIGFITTPIFTRLLTKAEFGDYNNFITWTGIIILIVPLNLGTTFMRALFDYKDDFDSYVKSIMVLGIISTIFFYGIFFLLREQITVLLSMDFRYISAMFLYIMFSPIITNVQTIDRMQFKYKRTVAISVIVALSTSILSVALVLLLPNKLDGRILGYVVPIIIVGFILLLLTFQNGGTIKISHWKYALPISLPFIPHLLSMSLLSSIDRIMIKRYFGSEELAIYGLAFTCASILSILVTSINSAFSPWLAEKMSEKKYSEINRISVPYVCFFTYLAGGLILLIPELVFILGGKSYINTKYILPPVAASCILQLIYCMYVNIEQFEKKTVLMAFASFLSMISNYILNSIFIPKYGYMAAAYTTYISYFLLMALHMIIVRVIGMSAVYKNKELIIISISSCLLSVIMNFLLDRVILRYAILLIYILVGCVLIYRKRTVFIQLISKKS